MSTLYALPSEPLHAELRLKVEEAKFRYELQHTRENRETLRELLAAFSSLVLHNAAA
jgi:hypothetical protein